MSRFTKEQIVKIIEGKPEGVSIKAYCAQVGMHTRLYYYHRHRLSSVGKRKDDSVRASAKEEYFSPGGFKALKVMNKVSDKPIAIVELPSRARISIFDPSILPLLHSLLK